MLNLSSPCLAQRCHLSSTSAVPRFTGSERVSRWSLRLAHDNTFLSYARNAIIATVAGTALFQYRKGEGRPPLAAAGLLMMGGCYMYIGSGLYVWQILRLRHDLGLGPVAVGWAMFNAAWPVGLWSVSLACLVDETPDWLISGLSTAHAAGMLPTALAKHLFLQSTSLQPIVRLLDTVQQHEQSRLQMMKRPGASQQPYGGREDSKDSRLVRRPSGGNLILTSKDYVTVISERLERLALLHARLRPMAVGESRAIPTSQAWPQLSSNLSSSLASALASALLKPQPEPQRNFRPPLIVARAVAQPLA